MVGRYLGNETKGGGWRWARVVRGRRRGRGGGEKREHTTAGAPLGLHFCSSMRAITFGAIVYYCRRHKEHKSMSLNDKRFAGVSTLKGRRCMTIQTGV